MHLEKKKQHEKGREQEAGERERGKTVEKHLQGEKDEAAKQGIRESERGRAPEKELAEIKETLQRVQAEFENYIKRVEKEKIAARERGFADAMAKMLPLLDSLDAAVENAKKADSMTKEDAVKGLAKLREQALSIMQQCGVKHIECVGKEFDAAMHDAVLAGNDKEKGDNVVLEELHKGYELNGRILRHAKVKVNKLEEEKKNECV